MARVQTQYQGRGEQTQAIAAPMIQPIQARFDPNDSGAFQLAKALGALNVEGFAANVQSIQDAKSIEDRKAAETYANSLTVDELGKRIKDGTMLPSQSPAFIGALQHIYGENSQASFERDTLSKLQSGELKFGSEQEMDEYLTKHRNQTLEGQSKFTTAGFDKGYNTFRERALTVNAKVVNEDTVLRGVQEASDNLGNVLLQVTSPEFKGDAAGELLKRYQLLRKTSLLRDDASKEALGGVLANISASGNTKLAEDFLGRTLDNGVSVRAVLGDVKSQSIIQATERQYDQTQRQRVDVDLRPFVEQANKGELDQKKFDTFIAANEKYLSTATIHAITNDNRAALDRLQKEVAKGQLLAGSEASQHAASQAVRTAVAQGTFAFLPQQQVMTPEGNLKNFQQKEAAQAALTEMTSQLPFGKQVEAWSTNGVENPEWEKQIKGGVSNIASVGWTFDGKNIGQLNEQGKAAIEQFMQINNTNSGYAQKLAGSEKDYKLLDDIQYMVERGGMPNVSDAAALVNQVNRSYIKASDFGSMAKKVQAAVDDVVNPGFFSGVAGWWGSLFGNDQVNLTAVAADIRRGAELLVMSGQVPDAAAAVKARVEYLANPAVTTKINNTLYFNKYLPAVPKGEEPGKWVERFISEVPGKLAKDQQMSGDVRLEPNQSGGFTAWIGGVPLIDPTGKVLSYRKDEVSQWINSTHTADRHKATVEANFDLWRERVQKDFYKLQPKDSLPGRGQGYLNTLTTRESYERFLRDGNAGKSTKELLEIHKSKQGK